MIDMREFSVESGIAVQTSNLESWKRKLNSKTYAIVFDYTTKNNNKAKSGYDVVRGDKITNFILNLK